MPLSLLAGRRPRDLGVKQGRLRRCPATPNCVCSDDARPSRHVAPLRLAAPPDQAWTRIRAALEDHPRTRIVTASADYLHAECRTALLGFVDDLELHLRPEAGEVAVRSASRLGHSDLGTNRRRVEALRADLVRRGAVAPETD